MFLSKLKQSLTLIKRIISHDLVGGAFFIFLGTSASSFLAFILNLFLARSLTYSDYGIFTSLLSLITLFTIPTLSFNTVILRFISKYFALNESEHASYFYKRILFYIGILSISVFILFFFLSRFISDFLKISDTRLIILTGLIVAVSYISVVNTSVLQSLLRFKLMSFISVTSGVIKLFGGIGLVYLGYKVFGGLWAIFFMYFITLILGFFPLKRIIVKHSEKVKFPHKEVFVYALPTSIAVISIFSLISSDVILVKHFFPADVAGLYGGLSVVGKVIFFFTAPIPSVMFPLLVKRHVKSESFNNIFYLALLGVLTLSLGITLLYFLFPNFIIQFFLGGREYLKVSGYLGLFGLYISLFSVLNLLISFFLSIKKTEISYVLLVGAISQIILIYFFHSSLFQVIGMSMIVCGLLIILLLLYYAKFILQDKSQNNR
ncbi:MAG: capsular polysaccharide biosynthesis protein [uncultured bacterium]|nr:MAG: capsular polysaccharide biosynthesis protein [uncultured bacterium]